MIFGGISYRWKSPLICIQININSDVYVNDCIDQSGIIVEMNKHYRIRNWQLFQEAATCHTSEQTIEYLQLYCNVIPTWPANSLDLNPIENWWAIIKKRVEELEPQSIEDLIKISFEVWENLSQNEIKNLIDSMPQRSSACIPANGMHINH